MTYEFHPLANLFPLIEGQEFEDLAMSILEHGLREPITLYEGKILDGRNRYRACEAAGVEPRFEEFTGGDPREFVCDKNVHRRHISISQRAIIAATIATIPHGGQLRKRPDMDISTSALTVDQAAKLLSVDPSMVSMARLILEKGTDDEIKAIREGKAAVTTLAHQIRKNVPADKRVGRVARPGPTTKKTNAKIWSDIRDAINCLTSLPHPIEVVRIARFSDRGGLLDARLSDALQYLTEFAHEWSNSDHASKRKEPAADRNTNAGNGRVSSGAQRQQPAD